MPSDKLKECSVLMAQKGLKIACAESATAGRLLAELALLPESGAVLIGGLVSYDAQVKTGVLKVSESLIKQYSPESAEVTLEMARCLGQLIPADIHVAITGLTTPGGSESPDKPVGTMFISILVNNKEHRFRKVFTGTPEEMIMKVIDYIAAEITLIIQ